ncbi:alpha/beta-hydrolase [Fomitiporia mediterranea MF3/22]|uniref:alpha/beta-hydrolase n=1 Tax=Fomitiporia mediterranea (strain MF3/22) TaxID=694068 RepID=UPI0004409C17|nr:alpha/beta-hydrolase [Fomitiporia mediterranea MF3/22]EJD03643.1 alpha/beta-hydrolase [Fomitiporia mediterranea MF3/22]
MGEIFIPPSTPADTQPRSLPHVASSRSQNADAKLTLTAPTTPKTTPLIMVEGFLSATGSIGWSPLRKYLAGFEGMLGEREVMIASVGPVSSLHDRACELYYTIKGGTVDYGEEHARQNGHKRFGRHHLTGLYPTWSLFNPLHFLGHSIGGTTIMKLQYLLSIGFFGSEGHPDMILSVTTVSAPFRGTQLVYSLGERKDSAPAVRPFSVGSAIAKAVHVLSYFSPLLPKSIDLHSDSRALSYHESSFKEFLHHLWRSDWAEGRDATPFDCTFDAADERDATDKEGVCNPRTYYTSFTALFVSREKLLCTIKEDTHAILTLFSLNKYSQTKRISSDGPKHSPHLSNILFPPLYLGARAIGTFDFSALKPPPSFLRARVPQLNSLSPIPLSMSSKSQLPSRIAISRVRISPKPDVEEAAKTQQNLIDGTGLSEHYWANDGVVPVFSQWHPRECTATKCIHHEASLSPRTQRSSRKSIEPGIWNVYTLENTHHLSILPLWIGSSHQRDFWSDLGNLLHDIESDTRRLYN